MKSFLSILAKIDVAKWAGLSLCVLWVSTTFSIALMEISFVVALVFWLVYRVREKGTGDLFSGRGVCPPQLWVPLAAFFMIVLLSLLVTEYPKQSFRGIFKIAKPILVFIMAADLFRDPGRRERFERVFALVFLGVAIDSVIQYVYGWDIVRAFPAKAASAGLRISGPFGDFGKMAAYLILVIPVFMMRFCSEWRDPSVRRRSFEALTLTLTGIALLFLTRSRGAFLAWVLSMFILFLYKRWFKAILCGILLLGAFLAVIPRGMIIHLDAEMKEQSVVERIELWKRALDVIKVKPWLGTGINTYNSAHAKYDTTQSSRVRGYYAHNGYLQLGAEIGVPGILFFILFWCLFLLRGIGAAHAVRGSPEELIQLGILTGLLAFLFCAFADTGLQRPQSLMSFWYLAGVLLSRQGVRLPGISKGSV